MEKLFRGPRCAQVSPTGAHQKPTNDRPGGSEEDAKDEFSAAETRRLVARKVAQLDSGGFIFKLILPEMQQLLKLPPHQAREAMVGLMSNVALQGMLLLAAATGPALDIPTDPSNAMFTKTPKLTIAYYAILMLTVFLSSTVTLFSTWFVSDFMCLADDEVYSVVVRSDGLIWLCLAMVSSFSLLSAAAGVRLWILFYVGFSGSGDDGDSGGEKDAKGATDSSYFPAFLGITIMLVVFMELLAERSFRAYATNHPVSARFWTKLFATLPPTKADNFRWEVATKKLTSRIRRKFGLPAPLPNNESSSSSSASGAYELQISSVAAARERLGRTLREYFSASCEGDLMRGDLDEFLVFVEQHEQRQQEGVGCPPKKLGSVMRVLASRLFNEEVSRALGPSNIGD